VVIAAFLLVGPRELPGLMRKIGRTVGDLRRAGDDLRRQVGNELGELPRSDQVAREVRQEIERAYSEPLAEVRAATVATEAELRVEMERYAASAPTEEDFGTAEAPQAEKKELVG